MKKRHYLTINAYWFGLAFMWNGLQPLILPALLLPTAGRQGLVPEALKNTYLGGMTFVGLILAMIVQPIAGALCARRCHFLLFDLDGRVFGQDISAAQAQIITRGRTDIHPPRLAKAGSYGDDRGDNRTGGRCLQFE